MAPPQETFFLVMLRDKDGELVGHAITTNEKDIPSLVISEDAEKKKEPATPAAEEPEVTDTFGIVFNRFSAEMRMYRNFIPLTLGVVPQIAKAMAERGLSEFGKEHGRERKDLNSETHTVFELDVNRRGEYSIRHDEIMAAINGADVLPQVMIIGLVSAYDAFLTQLLRVVFNQHPEIVLTSEKTISFSELKKYASIKDAQDEIIDREIESILRKSHHAQFETMETLFKTKLKVDLPIWPSFIELCERRNLLTHTGGRVSGQYLSVCKSHNYNCASVKVGDLLEVDSKYFSKAVHIVSEIGFKLCYVFWRKFDHDQRDDADNLYNNEAYELIGRRDYRTAEALLSFSVKVLQKDGKDSLRRMMIINLANAYRLQKNVDACNKLLDAEDWSAVGDEFALSLAAVKQDLPEVVRLMKKMGPTGEVRIQDYRTWPVFRGMRTKPEFVQAFSDVFGEPLFAAKTVTETEKSAAPAIEPAAPGPGKMLN